VDLECGESIKTMTSSTEMEHMEVKTLKGQGGGMWEGSSNLFPLELRVKSGESLVGTIYIGEMGLRLIIQPGLDGPKSVGTWSKLMFLAARFGE